MNSEQSRISFGRFANMVDFARLFLFLVVATGAIFYFLPNDPKLTSEIHVIDSNDTVEKYLKRYRTQIGPIYDAYRGHIYRVLTYSIHFLEGDRSLEDLLAAALVFHDIGIWTSQKFDYLEPSCNKAQVILSKTHSYSADELKLIHDIIYYHHKLTPYESSSKLKNTPVQIKNTKIINAVRMADLIDVSQGAIRHGLPFSHVQKTLKTHPSINFVPRLVWEGITMYKWNLIALGKDLLSNFK
jgi:hypothetical protein